MPDVVTVIEEVPEVVIPLSAMLETPNEPEELEVADEVANEVVVEKAAEVVEQKIEDAKDAGASKEELNELRGMLRDLRNDNIALRTRLSAAERVQKGEFGEDGKNVQVTELEEYQEILTKVAEKDFSEILAVMEVNPKYEDISVVCSGENFEDIFERVAQHRSKTDGTDFNLELVKVKAEVWSMANPYKYMYETIKQYHPKFQAPPKEEIKEVVKQSAKEVLAKKVVTAPSSVASMGGGDETKGGWTAERIDNMPEGQLHTVPKDVYKKWLSGELD